MHIGTVVESCKEAHSLPAHTASECAVSAADCEQAVILNIGDTVRMKASDNGAIRKVTSLEIVPATAAE